MFFVAWLCIQLLVIRNTTKQKKQFSLIMRYFSFLLYCPAFNFLFLSLFNVQYRNSCCYNCCVFNTRVILEQFDEPKPPISSQIAHDGFVCNIAHESVIVELMRHFCLCLFSLFGLRFAKLLHNVMFLLSSGLSPMQSYA